jgi:hypothetical protein
MGFHRMIQEYLSLASNHLFTKRQMNIEEAMAEIDGLNFDQIMEIAEGKTRAEILGINQSALPHQHKFFQPSTHAEKLIRKRAVYFLTALGQYGLTFEHLQGKDWLTGNNRSYLNALDHLFRNRMTADEAMAEIDGLDCDQAARIARGETRAQVLNPRPAV